MALAKEGIEDQIILRAREEFLKKGYRDASLREIAALAGTTTGTIYSRFKDKEGLFEAIVKPVADRIKQYYSESMDFFFNCTDEQKKRNVQNSVDKFLDKMLDCVYDNYEEAKVLFKKAEGTKYEHFMDFFIEIEEKSCIDFENALIKSGSTARRIDPQIFHLHSVTAAHNYIEVLMTNPDRKKALEVLYQLIDFYHGAWEKWYGADFC